jgi:hypothetical protein
MWDKALNLVPFKEDFILSVGTSKYDDNMALYVLAAERMLEIFSRDRFSLKITAFPSVKSKKDLYKLLNENSIVVCCLANERFLTGEHWVTAVYFDDKFIYMADSFKLVDEGVKYWEKVSPKYQRYYNHNKKLSPFSWLYNPSALQIAVE